MNDSLKNDNCITNISITSTSKTTDDVTVSTNDDTIKEKFMELLKNGPESEEIISYVDLSFGYFKFVLSENYKNVVVGVDLWNKPHTVYALMADFGHLDELTEKDFLRIEQPIKDDFGKKWEELAYKRLPSCRLAGGIHCTN